MLGSGHGWQAGDSSPTAANRPHLFSRNKVRGEAAPNPNGHIRVTDFNQPIDIFQR
jgi:hypothetical protein